MNPYLFVYGTLRYDSDHPMAKFLRRNAEFLGEGRFPGQVFDLGNYPGAVFSENATGEVNGHIFKLKEPVEILSILDRYEGIGDDSSLLHEYVRRVINIHYKESELLCWVYLYNLHDHTGGFPTPGR
jgi:gamma-glutamylcyclotransferase (GGCT)/AIG2-like uncharacterized protein YtfP